jgi:hypothetical protein
MSGPLLDVLTERAPLIATTVLVSLLAVVLQRIFARNPLSTIPYIGAELGNADKRRHAYLAGGKKLYQDGYNNVSVLDSTHAPDVRRLTCDSSRTAYSELQACGVCASWLCEISHVPNARQILILSTCPRCSFLS